MCKMHSFIIISLSLSLFSSLSLASLP